MPESSWTFTRDGLTFDVNSGGPARAGSSVVLLHGFPGSAVTWSRLAPHLHAAGLSTIAPTQRGYSPGARPRAVSAYRVDELAADVLALADAAGVERFHVVGHDWGGVVAWYLAARHAARLRSVTVLSTPHPRAFATSLLTSVQSLRSVYAAAFQLPVLPEALLSAADGRLLRSALTSSGLDAELAARYAADLAAPDAIRAALNWYRAAARHPRPLASVGTVELPTLYVWSNGDPALGGTAARLTAQHVKGPYEFVVLDGPHWLPEMAPDRIAELVVEHVGVN